MVWGTGGHCGEGRGIVGSWRTGGGDGGVARAKRRRGEGGAEIGL